MKVLVTGATGFVGSHLCELLTQKGHEVWALARSEKKFREFKIPGQMILGDLLNPKAWVEDLPQLDAVIHCAGLLHSHHSKDFYRVNTRATKDLIQSLSHKKLHFILVSSLAAAGPHKEKILTEEDNPAPVSHYGKSKLAAELLLEEAPSGWVTSIIRPPIVIGPRDPGMLDFFKMVALHLNVRPNPKALYSFICVFDLVQLIHLVLDKKAPGLFYASHPELVSHDFLVKKTREILRSGFTLTLRIPLVVFSIIGLGLSLLAKLKKDLKSKITSDKVKEITAFHWRCDPRKGQSILGVKYQWDIDQTIQLALSDYQKRGWLKAQENLDGPQKAQ